MAICTGGKLGVWTMGDKKWAIVDDGCEDFHFEDIAFSQWKDLGEQVMFVGDGCCFSVSAKDFVGLKKNCVYFSNDRFVGGKGHFPDWKAG
ncbi:hypothetical protein FEM48_Zijuj01G0107100 [Ziziphus jujuba var. spinosa]|uniref:KIB1-4 beta-propeller domain-containing protein n=1 Tax=Ziziphus jujuba var. spinosa TaxID=714518 RepID=A0A978W0T2_ZIZJJ|nr:hypothetical protein FEM48_Zijuj01G0107100 [Ziziphus jujuba var. spinosa]